MKISTKTGDMGKTRLMFGKETSKSALRVRAYGTMDEFASTLGFARSFSKGADNEFILKIQRNLVFLMTEIATEVEDFHKIEEKGMTLLDDSHLAELEIKIEDFERDGIKFEGWMQFGQNPYQSALDMARAKCRSAERELVKLDEKLKLARKFPIKYINRLSDLLWLMALNQDEKI